MSDRKSGSYNPYVIIYGGEPLTDENKMTVKRALNFDIMKIGEALDFVPFGNKLTVENIIRNTVFLGLADRIKFLDGTEEKERKSNE